MKRVILIHGMKRSGNHAVVNWLRQQDNFVFFNNAGSIMSADNRHAPIPKNNIEPIDAIEGNEPISASDPKPIIVVAAERNTALPVYL